MAKKAKPKINKALSDALGGGMIPRGPKDGAPLDWRKKKKSKPRKRR